MNHVTFMDEQPSKPAGEQTRRIHPPGPDGRPALFRDIQHHLLHDAAPSLWLSAIVGDRRFGESPFDTLRCLQDTPQSPAHHPEGSVWNHTMMVVDEAAKRRGESRDATALLWAALLHDIGKAPTTRTRKGRITSYDHDRVGAELARKFLREFTDDRAFIERVCALILYHMQILYVEKGLPYADVEGMKAHTDVAEAALLMLCDRLGRGGSDREREARNIEAFLAKIGR